MKLAVENLALARAGRTIVSGISETVSAGEALIVTGDNGSGKSTTLRGIAGLLPLEAGSVSLFDETGKRFENPVSEYCHYLGHQNGMKLQLTVHENLTFWQSFMGEKHLTIEEALEVVELEHTSDLPFSYLSAGQKRRISLARLLVSDRPVWVLDEPTAGLDAHSADVFSNLAQSFCADGGILVAATHHPLGLDHSKSLEIGALS